MIRLDMFVSAVGFCLWNSIEDQLQTVVMTNRACHSLCVRNTGVNKTPEKYHFAAVFIFPEIIAAVGWTGTWISYHRPPPPAALPLTTYHHHLIPPYHNHIPPPTVRLPSPPPVPSLPPTTATITTHPPKLLNWNKHDHEDIASGRILAQRSPCCRASAVRREVIQHSCFNTAASRGSRRHFSKQVPYVALWYREDSVMIWSFGLQYYLRCVMQISVFANLCHHNINT